MDKILRFFFMAVFVPVKTRQRPVSKYGTVPLPCGVVSGSGKIVNSIFIPLETSVLTHAFGNIYHRARDCAGCALKKQCTRNQANRTIIPRQMLQHETV